MKIKVSNCQECPFCNIDNEFGYDQCNLDKSENGVNSTLRMPFDNLPHRIIHYLCPLNKTSVTVTNN